MISRPTVGWAIITYNMAYCIEKAWLSAKDYVDQILVGIDDKTTDNTEQWCKDHNVPYFHFHFKGFAPARNEVIDRLNTTWVFTLDPDETILPSHGPAIRLLCEHGEREGVDSYYFVRHNWYDLEMTKERTDVYPDYHFRLFKRTLRYNGLVHEQPADARKVGFGAPLEIHHFNMYYCTAEDWKRKDALYARLGKGEIP